MSPAALRRLAWAVGLTVLTTLLIVAVRRLDLARVAATLRHTNPAWLIAAIGCYLASLPLWAIQWGVLAPPGPRNHFRTMLGAVSINATVYCTAVLVAGEATSLALLVTRIGLDRAAALSVITMDQLLVGFTKLLLFGAAALALPLPAWMRTGIISLAISVLALALGVFVIAWTHSAITDRIGAHLHPRLGRAFTTLGHALAPLRSPRRATIAFALALSKKGCEALAIICVQHAFGATLPFGSALLVLAALNLTTMLPLVPGNLGTFEATIVLIYTYLGMPAEQALGMALVQHGCYLVSFALPGYWWLSIGGSP